MTRTLALAFLIGTTLTGCGDAQPTPAPPPSVEQKAPTPPPKNPKTGLPAANPQ